MEYDSKRLLDILTKKWKTKECSMCGDKAWHFGKNVFELRKYERGGMVFGGVPIIPVIPVTCNNCGNTVLVNALVTKMVEPSEAARRDKEEDRT